MDAVAMADRDGPFDVKPDHLARWMLLAPDQRVAPDEIVGLGLERHGEADARLEWVGLIREVIAGEDQSGLDPNHIEGGQAHRRQSVCRSLGPDRVEDLARVPGVAPDLVAQLARVAGPRQHDR